MPLFGKPKAGGFMDEIRCDEPSYLIWKWHPHGSEQGNNNRENAIRYGSSLRVKDGEAAVLVYNQPNGTFQDFIIGPFDKKIETKNLPVLASIVGLAYAGGTPFQAEVYFINLAQIIQVKFAVPFFDVFDPRFTDFCVPVAVRGTITFKINDCKNFVKLHRPTNFSLDDFKKQIRDAVSRYVKDTVANAPAANNIPLVQIESKTGLINDTIEYDAAKRLSEHFGVTVSGIDIGAIELDKSSTGYKELMRITKDTVTAAVDAETKAKIKNITDKQRIDMENYEESLRIQREEGQYAQHKATQTANIGAYQIEKQAEVGTAGADALGKMGSNGAGDVNLSGGGFNMAAMMAGMAVGGTVGQNLAGTINSAISGSNPLPQSGVVPPPLPVSSYNVAINGQAAGPFNTDILRQMAASGQFFPDSLVWKSGMSSWEKAETIDELKNLFTDMMPPIPTNE